MTFDCGLANIRAAVLLPLLSKSDKKVLHEITVNSQGYLNPFCRIVGSSVTPQRHIITSPDT